MGQCWESGYLDGNCLAEQLCAFVTVTASPSTIALPLKRIQISQQLQTPNPMVVINEVVVSM
jgi:hypothetical protein